METPELKCPTTHFTPLPTNLFATETPCFGSDTSSPTVVWIFWPKTPPAALRSSTACPAPFFISSPLVALGPVIGPPRPSLIWAVAGFTGSARGASTAKTNANLIWTPHEPTCPRCPRLPPSNGVHPQGREGGGSVTYSTVMTTSSGAARART